MGFYGTKPAFRAALKPIARRMAILPADVWTWVGVAIALFAGALLLISRRQPSMLLWVAPAVFLRLVLNVLDGLVALETGTASARGEVLSEMTDRLSDMMILAAFALSGWGSARLAGAAIVVVLLVSYVGILGKAAGAGRQYGGWMGKPDRMAAVGLACWVQYASWRGGWVLPLCAFDAASWLMIALGFCTVIFRLVKINAALKKAAPAERKAG